MAKRKMSAEEKAVREALAAVQADTGIQEAQKILGVDTTTQSYQNFQSAGAALERISAQPGSTTKQIQDALTAYESAYQKQISTPLSTLSVTPDGRGEDSPVGDGRGGVVPGGGQVIVANVQPTPTTPLTTSLVTTPVVTPPVKTAPIDTLLIDQDAINIDFMTDLIFEDIGGQELINIARNDTVNGQTVSYQPIKNLTTIQQQYNPNNIVSLQNTSDKYFINFPIKLETRLLGEGEGSGPSGSYVYIEDATGDLIIELTNLELDEQIEVQISLSGTIYEAEFNES